MNIDLLRLKNNIDKVIEINEQSLPNDEGIRYNIILKKEKKTEKRYPRSWAEIQKKPL